VNHLQFCKYGSSVDRKEGLRDERREGAEGDLIRESIKKNEDNLN